MSVYSKLLEARLKLANMNIKKSGRNNFAGYDYYELQDFIKPIHDVMKDHGLFGHISIRIDTSVLTIVDTDDGAFITFEVPTGSAALKGCHDVQNKGAVITYTRRYLWMLAFEMTDYDQLDGSVGQKQADDKPATTKTDKEYAQKVNDKLKDQQLAMIEKMGQGFYGDEWSDKKGEIASKANVGLLSELTTKQLEGVIKRIDQYIAEAEKDQS